MNPTSWNVVQNSGPYTAVNVVIQQGRKEPCIVPGYENASDAMSLNQRMVSRDACNNKGSTLWTQICVYDRRGFSAKQLPSIVAYFNTVAYFVVYLVYLGHGAKYF